MDFSGNQHHATSDVCIVLLSKCMNIIVVIRLESCRIMSCFEIVFHLTLAPVGNYVLFPARERTADIIKKKKKKHRNK